MRSHSVAVQWRTREDFLLSGAVCTCALVIYAIDILLQTSIA
jgi:hypothetical protein